MIHYTQAQIEQGSTEWLSFVRCPECKHQLVTRGIGRFRCEQCGHEHKEDVSECFKMGLDYPVPAGVDIPGFVFGRRVKR